MNLLICGGAGYIGSHMVALLIEKGHQVSVIDNLSTGHQQALPTEVNFYQGDLRDEKFLNEVFANNQFEAVIDFAAFSLVGESVENPLKYFDNNVGSVIHLLKVMANHHVKKIVFSSTAATYGEVEGTNLITETTPTKPINPYGASKKMVEDILEWSDQAYGIKYTVLRYFNVAGAHPAGLIGEDHLCETHLIPLIIKAALGEREHIKIFGEDYPTPDGTCIRDYIHVMDLVNAHLLSLERLEKGGASAIYNLGNGAGFSVKEIVEAVEQVVGAEIPKVTEARRAGDPAILVASSAKATAELNWQPAYTEIQEIIQTAWKWHQSHPKGYSK
ncbi:UDP-glucose 4-epimerase GalE [Isobaculum melis]|uniref:UDP-glucose 4-epimerase n=1 Tax=Isobaculum melis TaxID=142588 RepID=A0A1H9U1M5_9LACT|nr:UDP-glucose 4-epimerase GalE [Isobaculum melis]SES02983.1 UDP-galactose 4-epimerase [Isobaculum melis]